MNRCDFRRLTVTFLLLSSSWIAPAQTSPFIPIGVWYGGGTVRAPMMPGDPAAHRDEWRRDLQAIRRLGFNSIKTWVDWASTEPKPGEFRFDALDQLLALADETGLRVIVQFYTDSAPEWIGAQFPDAAFVTETGARIHSQTSPGFCIDHPKVRAAMTAFIAAVSARARKHPSLYGFDVWSEPHIVNWVWFNTPAEFCYCPFTQARFREWLRKKYGSLDAVNASWYRTFEKWDQVEPPRYGTILSYTDFMDWKTFVADKLREDLAAKADATSARGALPISSHSDAPAVLLSPLSGFGNPDDWWMTRSVDYYGTSIYPRHASSTAPWSAVRLMAALDGIRSAARGRGWWIGELQAGQGVTGVRVGTPVTAADVRLWGWAAISRGARAISYYAYYPMSGGYESNGYGLIELNGTVTDRALAAGAFAAEVNRAPALFAAARPRPSRVAVLYNRLSYMVGGNTVGPGNTVRNSMMGFYRAMFERNIAVDFIHTDELTSGMAASYRAVYLGTPLMLPRKVADALKTYARDGGTLISEARPAWNDERGLANETIPGAGLDEVFGVRESELRSPESVVMTDLAGDRIPGLAFEEHLKPLRDGVKVLARFLDGSPAMTASAYGRGRAILIGTFAAAAFEQDPVKARAGGVMLQRLIADADVSPDVAIAAAGGTVDAHVLENGGGRVLIAINHDETPHHVTLRLSDDLASGRWTRLDGTSLDSTSGAVSWDAAGRDVLVLIHR